MEARYADYLALLEELRSDLDQLTVLAKAKNTAVLKDDLLALDEVLKQEQALSLSLRGLGQGQAKESAERLRASYDVYRRAAEVAKGTLERGLHELDKIVEGLGGPAAPPPPPAPLRSSPPDAGREPPPNMKTDFRA